MLQNPNKYGLHSQIKEIQIYESVAYLNTSWNGSLR